MEAYVFRFSADDLRKIERRTLGFLISSGHCCNELAALMPYIVFEHSLDDTNEVECALILSRRYTIDRIIVSKIVEYGELCDKFFKDDSVLGNEFSTSLKTEYEKIRDVFRTEKWARILRNKTSFHYDQSFALDSLAKLDGDHPLRLIAGKIKGLTLFDFSEEVFSRPIFEAAGGGDIGAGMDVAAKFIRDSIDVITRFHARSVISAFRQYGLVTEREQVNLRDRYCGTPGVDRVPLSIALKSGVEIL